MNVWTDSWIGGIIAVENVEDATVNESVDQWRTILRDYLYLEVKERERETWTMCGFNSSILHALSSGMAQLSETAMSTGRLVAAICLSWILCGAANYPETIYDLKYDIEVVTVAKKICTNEIILKNFGRTQRNKTEWTTVGPALWLELDGASALIGLLRHFSEYSSDFFT